MSNRLTLCPEEFFPFFPNHSVAVSPPDALFPLFTQWERTLQKLAPVLQGRSPTIFVSHAWHEGYYRAQKDVTEQQIKEAIYYDYFDLILTKLLKEAGFEVFYDKDLSNNKGIMDQGATPFMKSKVMSADIILAVCTPLYKERSTIPGTGVYIEVECIKERLEKSPTISFFIPILVHASNADFPVSNLLVGQDLERMKQVIYVSIRDSTTFISNMWRVLHRLWKNTKAKWEVTLEGDELANLEKFLQQYVAVLGELLQFEDYYDGEKRQPIASTGKDVMKNDFYSLRILTTLTEDIKPDVVLKLLRQEMVSHEELFSVSKDQDIVAVLGNTGVGKSTMINFLSGKALKADQYRQAYELVDKQDNSAFKIGSSLESETIYPQCVRIGNILYFDLPGFMDSNGSIRDLINAAFIYQIIVIAKSVRFIFLIGQDEITAQRGKIMKKLFSSIDHAFKDEKTILQSSMLVVTKSNFQFNDFPLLVGFLYSKLSTTVGATLREQLENWEHSNHIQHVPHPSFDDISNQGKIRESLLEGIERVTPMENERIPEFNLSGFYPPEVSLPLFNMFVYLIEQESAEFEVKDIHDLLQPLLAMNVYKPEVTQEEFMHKLSLYDQDLKKNKKETEQKAPVDDSSKDLYGRVFLDELPESLVNLISPVKESKGSVELINEYLRRTNEVNVSLENYSSDLFWMEVVWKQFDPRLRTRQELKLLTEIARDTYEQAKGHFQKRQQERVQEYKRIAPLMINAFLSSKSLLASLIKEETEGFSTKELQRIIDLVPVSAPTFPAESNMSLVQILKLVGEFEAKAEECKKAWELFLQNVAQCEDPDFWTKTIWVDFDARVFSKCERLKELIPTNAYKNSKSNYQSEKLRKINDMKSKIGSMMKSLQGSETNWIRRKNQFSACEDSFNRFLNCKLVYKDEHDSKQLEFSINPNADHFNGRFDLSKREDLASHFTFVTSFDALDSVRKARWEDTTRESMDVVIIPKFILDETLKRQHPAQINAFAKIPDAKRQPWGPGSDVAVFFYHRTGSAEEDNIVDKFRYSTKESMSSLSKKNLYSVWASATSFDKKYELAEEKAYKTSTIIFLGPCILTSCMIHLTLETCSDVVCCFCPRYPYDAYTNYCCYEICYQGSGVSYETKMQKDLWRYGCAVFQLQWRLSCCNWLDQTSMTCCECKGSCFDCATCTYIWRNALSCVRDDSYQPLPAYTQGGLCCCFWFLCCPGQNLAWCYRQCIHCCAKRCCVPCYIGRQQHQERRRVAQIFPEYNSMVSQLSRFRFSVN